MPGRERPESKIPTKNPQPAPAVPGRSHRAADADQDEAPAPPPLYGSVEEWVTRFFLPMFKRSLGGEYR
jgi:hypothetical protein